MKIHRFYVDPEIILKREIWIQDKALVHQWRNVLRLKADEDIVLFDGIEHDKLYKIVEINERECNLVLVTEYERKLPKRNIYLLWSLLKKDKNDWVLQKATELGVSHFLPVLADRSEKTGFNKDRANKIVIEAAEQCGRSDIPAVREPVNVTTALQELSDKIELYICEQDSNHQDANYELPHAVGVLIGPEGGWSDKEKDLFKSKKIKHMNLHDFTLRAETATLAAVSKLVQ